MLRRGALAEHVLRGGALAEHVRGLGWILRHTYACTNNLGFLQKKSHKHAKDKTQMDYADLD